MIWHILPINDLKPHTQQSICECIPEVKQVESGDLIIIHNAYDHRELVEKLLQEINNEL